MERFVFRAVVPERGRGRFGDWHEKAAAIALASGGTSAIVQSQQQEGKNGGQRAKADVPQPAAAAEAAAGNNPAPAGKDATAQSPPAASPPGDGGDSASSVPEREASSAQNPPEASQPGQPEQEQWAQVVGYDAIVRSSPSASAATLLAYPVGRRLRVLSHENGFAEVQDVESGQMGWVEERSLSGATPGSLQSASAGGLAPVRNG